jgi:hypothetical protein
MAKNDEQVMRPNGWLTIRQALSWIAFKSTDTDWDEDLYYGATNWDSRSVSEMIEILQQFIVNLDSGNDLIISMFCRESMRNEVRKIASVIRNERESSSPQDAAGLRIDAQVIINDLLSNKEVYEENRTNTRKAAEELRKAASTGSVSLYGWKDSPQYKEELPEYINAPRTLIPPETFNGPVFITEDTLLPRTDGDPDRRKVVPLYYGLLLQADDVLRQWPLPSADAPISETRSTTPKAKPGMSAPPKEDDAPSAQKRPYGPDQLVAWYSYRVRAWPPGPNGPTEAEDQTAANLEFGIKVPREHLRRVKAKLAPKDWRKSGPRRRN